MEYENEECSKYFFEYVQVYSNMRGAVLKVTAMITWAEQILLLSFSVMVQQCLIGRRNTVVEYSLPVTVEEEWSIRCIRLE